jgi:hypothetical protein
MSVLLKPLAKQNTTEKLAFSGNFVCTLLFARVRKCSKRVKAKRLVTGAQLTFSSYLKEDTFPL